MHLWEKIDAKSVVSAEGCPGRKRNFIWMLKKNPASSPEHCQVGLALNFFLFVCFCCLLFRQSCKVKISFLMK